MGQIKNIKLHIVTDIKKIMTVEDDSTIAEVDEHSSDMEENEDSDVDGSDDELSSEEDEADEESASEEEDSEAEGASGDENEGQKNKKKGKAAEIVVSKKKIGPQRQKKEIHICMKKAKKFEIRKLTRRITVLRNLKGTDEQKAKNTRKVDKLLLEIQAMKDFMIGELTERIVNMFKGTSEPLYLDVWEAAQKKPEVEKLLQTFSNGNDEKKYENIAFLRMVSSKDILSKLQMVASGMNIKKPKSKKALKRQLRKYNKKMKKMRLRQQAGEGGGDGAVDVGDKEGGETIDDDTADTSLGDGDQDKPPTSPKPKSQNSKPKSAKDSSGDVTKAPNNKPQKSQKKSKAKKSKQPVDSFFLPAGDGPTPTDDDVISSDDEFAAPVTNASGPADAKKKNRMGQRQRKALGKERENVKTMTSKSKFRENSKPKNNNATRKAGRDARTTKKFTKTVEKVADEKLHPSWLAKQKL